MKAIILKETGKYALVEKPEPEIRDAHDILIRIEASSICGSDVHILADQPGIPAVHGTTIGHEMVGTVEEIGSGVTDFKVGDRMVLDNNISCCHCAHCKNGHPNMCLNMRTMGVDEDGAFAEYAVVPERMAVKIPQDMPVDTAIFAEPLNCVMGAVNKIRLLPGETVLIIGAGPIGLYFAKLLALNGAGKIFISETSDYRIAFAKAQKLGRVVNPREEDLEAVILKETNGLGVNVSVDAVGTQVPACIQMTRCNGRVLLFGNNSSVQQTICQTDITRKELTIMGSFIGPHTLQITTEVLKNETLNLQSFITHCITLSDFETGINAMRKGEAIEVVITPD